MLSHTPWPTGEANVVAVVVGAVLRVIVVAVVLVVIVVRLFL